jgi:hypothetical protein
VLLLVNLPSGRRVNLYSVVLLVVFRNQGGDAGRNKEKLGTAVIVSSSPFALGSD